MSTDKKLMTFEQCFKEVYSHIETGRLLEMRKSYIGRRFLANNMMELDTTNQIISNIECELRRRNVSYE